MFLTNVKTELFEIELIICIKMNLALNNLQRLICHKTQLAIKENQNKEQITHVHV